MLVPARIAELLSLGKRRDIAAALVIILVGAASFGLGRLSKVEEGRGVSIAVAPETAASAALQESGRYVASRNGTTYALPSCPSAKAISEANRVWFASSAEAERAGYRPAANCKGL